MSGDEQGLFSFSALPLIELHSGNFYFPASRRTEGSVWLPQFCHGNIAAHSRAILRINGQGWPTLTMWGKAYVEPQGEHIDCSFLNLCLGSEEGLGIFEQGYSLVHPPYLKLPVSLHILVKTPLCANLLSFLTQRECLGKNCNFGCLLPGEWCSSLGCC